MLFRCDRNLKLATVSYRSSRSRRQRKRLLLKVPINLEREKLGTQVSAMCKGRMSQKRHGYSDQLDLYLGCVTYIESHVSREPQSFLEKARSAHCMFKVSLVTRVTHFAQIQR